MHSADAVRVEMTSIVRLASEPALPGEHIAQLIRRASVRLGIGYARARKHWYGQLSIVPAHEADALREARDAILRRRLQALDAEAALLRARLGGESQDG